MIGRITTLHYLAIVALLISTISCARPPSIELSVIGAALTHDVSGRTAIDISLSGESRREFGSFTSKSIGRFIEVRFLNETLTRARLMSSIDGGHLQISASLNPVDGILSEANAAEIVRQLSSNNTKLEIRVADEKK